MRNIYLDLLVLILEYKLDPRQPWCPFGCQVDKQKVEHAADCLMVTLRNDYVQWKNRPRSANDTDLAKLLRS